ncbi:MAG: ribosome-associated translation inhibitor RaiA [Deltaproteobacteria bacterium]|nr:ribosome-associated translation inhibitor RaiA [Deltaproteobacteria bacterium]
MQISVTFRNMKPSEALKSYAEEKITRLKKYVSMPADVHIVLAKSKYRNQADIKLMSRGIVMRGEEDTEDMYSSIDSAVDKIERQARKYKDKIRQYAPISIGEEIMVRHNVIDQETVESDKPRIIRSEEFQAKPMSVDEAVMQMDLMNNDFLVFMNANTRDINVVYRRNDGNMGLIEAKTPGRD